MSTYNRSKMLALLIAISSGLIVSCCGRERHDLTQHNVSTAPVKGENEMPIATTTNTTLPDQSFNYGQRPAELLRILRLRTVVVDEAPVGWITKEDVRALIPMIRSDEKCGFIVARTSSYTPSQQWSTIGREAIFLVDGYREGFFPPAVTSQQIHYISADKIEEWYSHLEDK